MNRVHVYGYTLETDHPLVSFLAPSDEPPDLVFTCTADFEPPRESGELIYESVLPGAGDEGLFSLYRMERGFKLHYSGTADFYIGNDQIHCHLLDPVYDYWVEIALLGPVLSFWLELRGSIALHASAVVRQGKAIGFIAASKSGKTSLAASFMEDGARLLTDDILPLHLTERGGVMARPGYPQLRMWPDQARVFAGDPARYPLAHPDYEKRRVPAAVIGGFHGDPAPLSALLLPERGGPAPPAPPGPPAPPLGAPSGVTLSRVPTQEALMILLRSSFAASVLERMPEMQIRRLGILAEILQKIPVFRLEYPEGYDRLPEVRNRLIQLLDGEAVPL